MPHGHTFDHRGRLVQAAYRSVERDGGVARAHVDDVDEGLDSDGILGGEDRAL